MSNSVNSGHAEKGHAPSPTFPHVNFLIHKCPLWKHKGLHLISNYKENWLSLTHISPLDKLVKEPRIENRKGWWWGDELDKVQDEWQRRGLSWRSLSCHKPVSVPRSMLPVLPSKVSVTPLTPRLRKEEVAWEEVVCSSGKRMKFGARHTCVHSWAPSLTSYVFGKVTPLSLVCKCRLHSRPRELLGWLTTAYRELSAQRRPCLRGQEIGDFHVGLHKEVQVQRL